MSSRPDRPPVALSRATLPALPPGIRLPAYDVAAVRPGIVHLGLGGFHRAHMARYTHELMELDPDALQWGILGAVLLPDRGMIESLTPQDGLYTLIEREGEDEHIRVIGSLAVPIYAGESSAKLLDAIDDPAIRIVSLTVTENGYCLDPATKRLNPQHDRVMEDLAKPAEPRSAIGVLVEALRRRRAAGMPPFTALTCDNIQGNGLVLRDAVLDHARLRGGVGDLADWIAAMVNFPSTMVDRITPVTSHSDIEALATRHGVDDRWPVVCETFSQWVVEDRFPGGRPAWERVGAQFVPDVEPYEFMKLRLLNASHLAVSGLGRLAGYATIAESMADRRIAAVMVALMDQETGPTVPPVGGIDLPAYKRRLVERFANPAIRDTVDRVNNDAPLNLLVDPIRSRLEANASVDLLGLALAAWLRRVTGEDERGAPIPLRHPQADLLRTRAREGGPDPMPLLSIRSLFGELGDDPRLVGPVREWLALLYELGIQAVLDRAARHVAG
jgi:mannitol 2-dehydrogenase